MELKARYQADAKKAKDGVPVKLGDATFILAYSGSSKAKLILHSRSQQYSVTMDSEDAVVVAMHDVLADEIVLGWKGLKEDGKTLKYSKQTLKRILSEYVGLDLELMERASEIESFQRKSQEKTEKNPKGA